jgi:hypothetical protein
LEANEKKPSSQLSDGSGANDGFVILLGFAVRGEFSISNGIDEVTTISIG